MSKKKPDTQFIPSLAVVFILSIVLFPARAEDLGVSFSMPEGFSIQDRKEIIKTWPSIYMVRSADETDTKTLYEPVFLLLSEFNSTETDMLIRTGNQMKGTHEQKIGKHTVVVLPAFPGPHGEDAFFYIVPRGDGTSIGVIAPRYINKRGVSLQDRPPSGMDSIAETLIKTIAFKKQSESR